MINEIKTNVLFKNDENLSGKYLWRYMDLHKFLSFIISKSLHLTRLDKFEDKREGISINNMLLIHHKKQIEQNLKSQSGFLSRIKLNVLPTPIKKGEDQFKSIQRFNFANCWVIGDENIESIAMWNLYSDPKSIAIRIKYSDFKSTIKNSGYKSRQSIDEIICSPVEYVNFQSSNDLSKIQEKLNDSVFIKDVSFEHEKEFRIIGKEKHREIEPIKYKEGISDKDIERIHNQNHNYPDIKLSLVDFEKYNFEIIHHSKANEWTKKNIKEIITQFGVKFKISDSNLELK